MNEKYKVYKYTFPDGKIYRSRGKDYIPQPWRCCTICRRLQKQYIKGLHQWEIL